MGTRADLTGNVFGSRVVVKFAGTDNARRARWLVRCACGDESIVLARHLKNGKAARCSTCANKRHGWCHGNARTPEWKAWAAAKQRCANPRAKSFKDYGGRGIRVCNEWQDDFAAFITHVGPKPSSEYQLDRVNNDGDYAPGNVRWATPSENSRNRRRLTHAR